MKHKKLFRSVTALLAALVLMGGFSVTAFAGGGDVSDEPPTPVTETEPEETTGGYEPQPLTPEGNMSLVDDITGEASGDKQFITVVTKNGNYFYIIIDRAEDGENTVHFLNQVDEKDLLQLMEDEQTETCLLYTSGREATPEEYVSRITAVFHEVKRVLTPEGTCWLNIADTYCGTGSKADHQDRCV